MSNTTQGLATFVNRRLFIITLISTFLASLISAVYALTEFNMALKPQLLQKANLIAEEVQNDVRLAVGVGIPFGQINGLDEYLEDLSQKYSELTYIAVSNTAGDIIYQGGDISQLVQPLSSHKTLFTTSDTVVPPVESLLSGSADFFRMLLSGSDSQSMEGYYLPLTQQEVRYGSVHIGLNDGYIRSQLTNVFFDLAIVLIAVLLVSFELMMVLVMFYVSGPLQHSEKLLTRQAEGDFSVQQNQQQKGIIGFFVNRMNQDSRAIQNNFQQVYDRAIEQKDEPGTVEKLRQLAKRFSLQKVFTESRGSIIDARIPLFVFSFAEELQKSFMPLFVAEYYQPNSWISRDIMIGLPISVFMGVIAIITPFAGRWTDRYGCKRIFMVGLIPAICGYLICAFANSAEAIIAGRGVTAAGYAVITISCQGYMAALLTKENRAKGMAVFVGVLMTASMCGTALGGIIADRIGYQPVFVLAAMLALVAGALAWVMLCSEVGCNEKPANTDKAAAAAPEQARGPKALIRNYRFVGIILFCAIPAKIILTGFLYYFVPVYLITLDATQAEIGRIMMIYALIIIFLGPTASHIADRSKHMIDLVVFGTVLSGAILLLLNGDADVLTVLISVILMGMAHAIIKAPLIAAALEAAEYTPDVGRTTVLSVLRTCERIGSVIGPLLVAALLVFYDYGAAMAIIGVGIIGIGCFTGVYFRRMRRREAKACA
ncbi:MFS transporter [Aliamphritea hakodatensis]|uniref:MFS transporter n=1 Tax=Aliamphritea hakodatensis TaxID=2895352 RepID=UPI0022FD8104|nr:MFS transporter [Aliamphritea hakodatensis]